MNQSAFAPSTPKNNRKHLKCTCEKNNMKILGKRVLRYSMCDVCSERWFRTHKNVFPKQ
jgi:hypothetical protein